MPTSSTASRNNRGGSNSDSTKLPSPFAFSAAIGLNVDEKKVAVMVVTFAFFQCKSVVFHDSSSSSSSVTIISEMMDMVL